MARFVGASERATVFTKNISEAINLVAYAWGLRNLRQGDEILVTEMEHHSNLVPWQLVAGMTGARVRAVPVTGTTCSTWMPSTGCSASGPAWSPSRPCRTCSAPSTRWPRSPSGPMPPGRWSWPTPPRPCPAGVRLDTLGVDFLGFTGHKALGPMGVGVLAARRSCWRA